MRSRWLGTTIERIRRSESYAKIILSDFRGWAASASIMVVMIESQAEIDHSRPFRDNLGPATKAGQEMSNVAVVALDGNREVLAGEPLFRGDQPMISVPVVGDEGHPLGSRLVEEPAAGCIITATQNPGHGSPADRIIGAPEPKLACLFFTKCHISSMTRTLTSAGTSGSGRAWASARTQRRTDTSLTPRMRPIIPKLMLPIAESSTAIAFIAAGLPLGGVFVKLQPQDRQR